MMNEQELMSDRPQHHPRIKIHSEQDFAGMRKAGQMAAEALDLIAPLVVPGNTTEALNDFVVAFANQHNIIPATVGYRGYPKATCTSLNHVVCHGIPGDTVMREGDIINIDVTFIVDGWFGDSSRMYYVGEVSRKAERLVEVTYECLMRGIAMVKPGAHLGDIGYAIQTYAEKERCSVVRDFCGHGLGRVFHDQPNVLHYGRMGEGARLEEGMFFTIEPMINLGKPHVKVLNDGWTAVTRDRSLSAQFEHAVGVTASGCEIFTLSPRGLNFPPYKL